MMKRTPKTRTASTRQLTQELEAVKGGWVLYPIYPSRIPLNKDESEDDHPTDRPGT